jgi:hypothetical protein
MDRHGNVKPSSDRTGKMVVLHGQMLLGFTGVGELDGMPMDEWVLEALMSTDPQRWLPTLASRAAASLAHTHGS